VTTEELRDAILSLPPLADAAPPRFSWAFRRADLRNMLLTRDPHDFLTWPVVTEALFVGNAPWLLAEWDALVAQPDFLSRWRGLLTETGAGKPPRYPAAEYTSGNLIHQCYYLLEWEKASGRKLADLGSVLEIGAGYGAMARIVLQAMKWMPYAIHDFPELALLQKWYLEKTETDNLLRRARWTDLNAYRSTYSPDLLIACCSLDEMPIEERECLLLYVQPHSVLVVYHDNWDGVDNTAWFHKWARRTGLTWEWKYLAHVENMWIGVGHE